MSDAVTIFVLSLTAALNPTLLAGVTVMMLLPNTRSLMLGYLLGAYLASVGLGLAIVFSLDETGAVSTARSSLTPAEDIAFGVIALAVSYALLGGRAEPLRERRRARREAKQERGAKSWPERMLGRGSSRVAFVVGVALTLPGASYLVALHRIAGLELSPVPTVLVVVGFCLVQMLLLEVPLLGYALAPERTEAAVVGFREWLARSGRRTAGTGAAIIGALLVLRGAIELLA